MARMTMRAAAAASLLMASGWAIGADDVRIGDLAPKTSLAVIGVENWARSEAALKESELWALWNEPEMKTFVAELWKDEEFQEGMDDLKDLLDEIGVDKDELSMPTGSVGFAFFTMEQDGATGLEAFQDPPQMMAFADFGANAAKMKEQMETALGKLEQKGEVDLAEETHDGATVWVITPKPDADEPPDAGEGEDEDSGEGSEGPAFKEMRAAWVGDRLVMSTSKDHMNAAIDRLGGDDIDSVADEANYAKSLAQHPDGTDAHAVLMFTEGMRGAFRQGMTASLAAMAPVGDEDVKRIVDAMGLSAFQGASVGFKINSDAGVTEQSIGVLLPEKTGLFMLLDGPAARFAPPSFIGPEVSSVSQIGVRFGKLFEFASAIAGALPADLKDQAVAAVQSGEGMLGPAIKAMGPEVYIVESLSRPIGAESKKSVVAIKTTDALSIANILTGFAPQFGAEIRDFQGNPIYEMADAGMSLGLGAGHVFIGTTDEVENLLRRAGMPDAAGIASEARFAAAGPVFGEASQFYGFTDFVQSLEWDIWSMQNADKVALKELESFMEVTDELRKEYAEMVPAWAKSVPPIDVFKRHLGDIAFSMRSTPDGFRGRMVQMRPRAK